MHRKRFLQRPTLLAIADWLFDEETQAKSPLKKGAKAAGLGGCPGRFANQKPDNPSAVSAKPLSPFVGRL
jgi:hypothetical protein